MKGIRIKCKSNRDCKHDAACKMMEDLEIRQRKYPRRFCCMNLAFDAARSEPHEEVQELAMDSDVGVVVR